MVLLLTRADLEGMLSLDDVIGATETFLREEANGATVHMAPFGGTHAGLDGGGVARVSAGGAFGLGCFAVLAPGVNLLFDGPGGQARLLALMQSPYPNGRVIAMDNRCPAKIHNRISRLSILEEELTQGSIPLEIPGQLLGRFGTRSSFPKRHVEIEAVVGIMRIRLRGLLEVLDRLRLAAETAGDSAEIAINLGQRQAERSGKSRSELQDLSKSSERKSRTDMPGSINQTGL